MSPAQFQLPIGAPATRRAAHEHVAGRRDLLQARCLEALRERPLTADEVADAIGESPLSIRPRITELRGLGRVVDTGERRRNASGRSAAIWRLT